MVIIMVSCNYITCSLHCVTIIFHIICFCLPICSCLVVLSVNSIYCLDCRGLVHSAQSNSPSVNSICPFISLSLFLKAHSISFFFAINFLSNLIRCIFYFVLLDIFLLLLLIFSFILFYELLRKAKMKF